MVPYLLNAVYALLLIAAAPWLLYQSIRKGKYREGFAAKFLGHVPIRSGNRPCLWLHAVSVGEVNLLASLLAEIDRRRLEWDSVISTTTITGYALAKKKYPGRTVFYCPLDFSWAVRTALARVRPTCLVLAELELWPNLVAAARERGTHVAIINGRLSDHSFRGYRQLRPLVSRVLRQIGTIAVQNEEYAARFRALGASAVSVHTTGSMKYDGAQTNRANPQTERLSRLAGFQTDDMIFLAGSTQDPEESLALETFRQLSAAHPRLRLILVPRHADRFDAVAAMLERSGLAWQRRSELDQRGPNPAARILLVDAIGELGAWWGTARIAFVGGSLQSTRGGQNMIEPAAYGAAVSFGPDTRNFRDIVATLLAHEAAVVVQNGAELTNFVRRAIEERGYAELLGRRARSLVQSQLGATSRTLDLIVPLVSPAVARDVAA